VLSAADQEITELPLGEISRTPEPRRAAIFSIGSFREKL